jgi:hypothetical protein
MNIQARHLAQESWDAVRGIGPLYADIALSSDFRLTLDDVANAHLQGRGRSGIAALEAFEDEVERRLKESKADAPAGSASDDARTLQASKPTPDDDVKVSAAAKRLSKKSRKGGK